MAAADGQTLQQQTPQVQAMFQGNSAAWDAQHNAAIGAGGSGSTTSTSQNPQLQQSLQQLQQALASGDQKQYDLALATLMGVMNGQPTLDAQKLAELTATDQAKQAETAREFNLSQGQSLLDTASKLNSPQDWGKYLQYTSGGKSLYDQAMTGRPASGAPVGTSQPQTLESLMSAFGMTGAPAATAAPAAAANPAAQQATFRQLMGLAPNYMPGTNYTPADVQASGGYANAKASNFATFGGKDPTMGGGGAVGGGADTTGDQATYRSLMGDAPDYSPTTMFTPDQVRASGGYQNAAANNFATFGGRDPLLGPAPAAAPAPAPAAPAAPATTPNPAPTGIGSLGESANNTALLNSLGFGAPNLSQADLTRMAGGTNPNATANDVLASPTYRGLTNMQGTPPDNSAAAMQQYEQKLQTLNNPGAMDPAFWDSLGPEGQQAWLGAAQQIFGWTPTEYVRQINATRPLGSVNPPQSIPTRFAPVGM